MEKGQNTSKALNIFLWISQGLLALMFLMTGTMKLTQTIEQLATSIQWVRDVPVGLVKFIGISEFLGGIGLFLPAILRIRPKLTFWAAVGILTIMIMALIFHISRGEFSVIAMNIILGLVAGFVAWGRFKKAPIHSKK